LPHAELSILAKLLLIEMCNSESGQYLFQKQFELRRSFSDGYYSRWSLVILAEGWTCIDTRALWKVGRCKREHKIFDSRLQFYQSELFHRS
jgi:hypothetical protein